MNRQSQFGNEYRDLERDQIVDRVTATEMIDGVKHLLVLEQDATGCYREVMLEPVNSRDGHAATAAAVL